MDFPSLDPAGFRPLQLRTAAVGSAGMRFDVLLDESRARVESDDLGAHRASELDDQDATDRDEGAVPDRAPRWNERDEDSAPDPDRRDNQPAQDSMADRPGDPQQQTRTAPGEPDVEVANDARLAMSTYATTARAAASSTSAAANAPAPTRPTLAAVSPRPGSQATLQHGPAPQGTESATPPGPGIARPLVRFLASPRPPFAPPQFALGAQAVLAAQSIAAVATQAQPGAQGAVPGNTTVKTGALAMAGTTTDSTGATSNDAARKAAVGPKGLGAQQSATVLQTSQAAGNTAASPPPFKLNSAPAGPGAEFAGQAGARPLGVLGFAAPSIGLPTALSGDYGVPGTRPAASLPLAAEQVAVQIQKAAHGGQDKINIKLYPADLGRVLVKLDFAEDGTLRAVISAERSETLDLLQRDSRALDRALQDAGLKTDSGSLSFDLRGHAGQRDEASEKGVGGHGESDPEQPARDLTQVEADAPTRERAHDGVLDLRV